MNTINETNFNRTMQGYFDYAINFAKENGGITEEQITLLQHGLNWATSEMTMEDARQYKMP